MFISNKIRPPPEEDDDDDEGKSKDIMDQDSALGNNFSNRVTQKLQKFTYCSTHKKWLRIKKHSI